MLSVSARRVGDIWFVASQALISCLPAPKPVDRLLISCFLGCRKPALAILKNMSLPPTKVRKGVILIIAASTFGFGQKEFLEM
jgi:hypothetical protein